MHVHIHAQGRAMVAGASSEWHTMVMAPPLTLAGFGRLHANRAVRARIEQCTGRGTNARASLLSTYLLTYLLAYLLT